MLITRKLSEFLQEFFMIWKAKWWLSFLDAPRISLNNYCKLRFDVCISQCQNVLPRFFNNCLFFWDDLVSEMQSWYISSVFFKGGEEAGGETWQRGRGNVPELSASVRQSQFIPKPTNNLSKFLAGRGRESSRQHSLICIQNKDVWTRHGAGKIVRRHWCTCIES